MRKLTTLLAALVLLLSLIPGARAAENPDPDRIGSITFRMETEEQLLNTGKLTLYRVGDIAWQEGGWYFDPVEQLQDSGLSFGDIADSRLAAQVEEAVKESGLPGQTAAISRGKAVFADLQAGLYLVTQKENHASDGFAPINSFLFSLPQQEAGSYVYEITAAPKVSLETVPTETTEPTESVPTDPKLPQTGQMNWPVPLMAAAGLAFLILGWFLCFRKGDTHET